MTPELPQPFEQEAIRKDPKAVVIALLIGLLLIFGSVIGVLYYRKEKQADDCKEETKGLYTIIIEERNARIYFYERMIFYKNESRELKAKDSLLKNKTAPYVQKLIP
ncbi:hypothetical protein ABE425_05405 [Chryseobacterium cucumeris]|uniref:hypothetical protein n=1 Tax=Chryseobacterium cucumeris TaxID=1813611 RepID=UPI003208C298